MTIVLFVLAAAAIFAIGPRLARVVEVLADRLGVGQVLAGAVLLGVVTSLPGLVLTVTAAARGEADLAVSNALGGVAAQTFFIAIADIAYRRGTLANGVVTREVAFQSSLLVVLLALVLVAVGSADTTLFGRVHPITPLLIVVYAVGLRLSRSVSESPPELDPASTSGAPASPDASGREPQGSRSGLRGKLGKLEEYESDSTIAEVDERSTSSLWLRFAVSATVLAGAGFVLASAGADLAATTPLSVTAVGVGLTAVATSLPELVTAVAAARRGAIGLAAGDIIGGNVFDTLFIAAADLVAEGSVYADAGSAVATLCGVAVLLNGLLLAGLVRQGRGRGDVDIESLAIIAVWMTAVVAFMIT